ncbi:fumarylacetoacetate hydrolase family protein [Nocardioides sp. NPDC058538]|uniref:fumarylacetoacetate hydrolase family protein n=1 Tax=Nocardioides sp. NPDC058538 TaxID=3346542 RepID=UPI00365A1BF1
MILANVGGRLTIRIPEGDVDVEVASGGRFEADPQAVYERWAEFRAWFEGFDWPDGRGTPVAPTAGPEQLGPPSPTPGQVFAIGLNYRDHAAESGLPVPEVPPTFTKFQSALTGPTGDIELPEGNVDWEVELVAVVGREARNVPVDSAWEYIAGLTIGQDLSERIAQMSGTLPQFSLSKSHPGFGPMGPVLVTTDEVADRDDLELGCSLNGEVVQRSRTSELVLGIPELVAQLSDTVTLRPGDVIFTGTPSGVGMGRSPQRFLCPGDELVTWVDGIGEMRHRFVGTSK